MTTQLRSFVHRTERIGMILAGALHKLNMWVALPVLVAVVSVDVIMRFGFNSSVQGGAEIGSILLLMVFIASLPYATLRHGHVYMELIHVRLAPRARRSADFVAALCGLFVMAIFTLEAVNVFRDMIRYDERGLLSDIPYWPFAGLVLLCGVFVTMVFIVQLLRLAAGLPVNREEFSDD